jgi:transcriptional regulator GlxA family with amidase domain
MWEHGRVEEVTMSRPTVRIAIVAYQGVLADESWAFRSVLSRIPGARVLTVGDAAGIVAGPGGAQQVVATYDDVTAADVVVIPGGLGSHRHPEISAWLRRLRPRWVLASSTGSALLAAGGLLRGRAAATHWLAGPLLERCDVAVSTERLVVDPPFVTCTGLASTFDAAFIVVASVAGPDAVDRIRDELRRDPGIEPPVPCVVRTRYRPRQPRQHRPTAVVEVELEEHPPTR